MSLPTVGEVFAAFFSARPQAGDPGHCIDSRDRVEAEPERGGTMTTPDATQPEPEPDAEAEAEWADEWDSADSSAYMDRVEAGLEPEAEMEAAL